MIKRLLKRIFIFIVTGFLIYFVFTNISFIRDIAGKKIQEIIIDAGSGDGSDAPLAIARLLASEDIRVTGLLASQWQAAYNAPDSSVLRSRDIHQELLVSFNNTSIPCLRGSNHAVQLNENPTDLNSDASAFIIKKAQETPSGEKMKIIVLGSATNVAASILLNPDIIPKLDCYLLGLRFDVARRVWNKNEFNVRSDLDALDILLNATGLEMHIMPRNLAGDFFLDDRGLREILAETDQIWSGLLQGASGELTGSIGKKNTEDRLMLNCLALVQAFVHPEMASEKQVITPPENTQRKIYVYTRIDAERMKKDFAKFLREINKEDR